MHWSSLFDSQNWQPWAPIRERQAHSRRLNLPPLSAKGLRSNLSASMSSSRDFRDSVKGDRWCLYPPHPTQSSARLFISFYLGATPGDTWVTPGRASGTFWGTGDQTKPSCLQGKHPPAIQLACARTDPCSAEHTCPQN